MEKVVYNVLAMILLISLTGCRDLETELAPVSTQEVTVKTQEVVEEVPEETWESPIDGLSDDFIFGMDASSVLTEEKSGVKYYGFDGKEQDIFKTYADSGINYIRLRVWNDPYDENGNGYGGGNNDLPTAVGLNANLAARNMQAGVLHLSRMHLKSAIISKYLVEILQRNPARCTRTRCEAEFRNEVLSYSMTACVKAKTAQSTGDIAALVSGTVV